MLPVQVGLAAGDLVLASSVIFVLLPPDIGVGLPHVLVSYLLALLAGLVSHVPGGLGVFESIRTCFACGCVAETQWAKGRGAPK